MRTLNTLYAMNLCNTLGWGADAKHQKLIMLDCNDNILLAGAVPSSVSLASMPDASDGFTLQSAAIHKKVITGLRMANRPYGGTRRCRLWNKFSLFLALIDIT